MTALVDDGLASVLSIVGHPDARYGYYSTELNFDSPDYNLERAPIGNITNDNLGDAAKTLLPIALDLLNKLGLENLKSLQDPMSNCFYSDELGNSIGYDGYAKQLCVSNAGIRYTDYYHFSFEHYQQNDNGYIDSSTYHHNLILDESLVISFKNLGTLMNNNMFRSVYVTPGASVEDTLGDLELLCALEYVSMAAGELIVINIDTSSEYTMNDIQVTSTSGEIKWYNSNSFIMPDGDVTISLKTSSGAEAPTITESPTSPVQMTAGDSVSLTVSASVSDDGSLSYAWYAATGPSDKTVGDSKRVASSATYRIPADKPEGVYYYFCVVTNTLGTTSSTSTSDVVTVQITSQTYSISFETNGGSPVDDSAYQSLKQGDALSLLSSEKFGFQFDGWYSDAALSIQAPAVMPAEKLILHAKWNNALSPDGSITAFENDATHPWIVDETMSGSPAYTPSNCGMENTKSIFSFTVSGPGKLYFYCQSFFLNDSTANVYVDEHYEADLISDYTWGLKHVDIVASGEHTVSCEYSMSVSAESDNEYKAWIKEIVFVPADKTTANVNVNIKAPSESDTSNVSITGLTLGTNNVSIGSTIPVTVTSPDNLAFVGWQDGNGNWIGLQDSDDNWVFGNGVDEIITDNELTFTAFYDLSMTAVFLKKEQILPEITVLQNGGNSTKISDGLNLEYASSAANSVFSFNINANDPDVNISASLNGSKIEFSGDAFSLQDITEYSELVFTATKNECLTQTLSVFFKPLYPMPNLCPDNSVDSVYTFGYHKWVLDSSITDRVAYKSTNQNMDFTWSSFAVEITGSGKLSFDYCISSERNYDILLYNINQEVTSETMDTAANYGNMENYSGEIGWKTEVITITAADTEKTVIYFAYCKGGSTAHGQDTSWISNIRFAQGAKTITLTAPDSSAGTVAGTYNSSNLNIGENKIDPEVEVSLTATPKDGYHFYGWIDVSGRLLSLSNTYSFTVLGDVTITAVFALNDTYAARNGGTWYESLEEALNTAVSGDAVVLLKDYTLTQNATVPNGVFLVLPYSDSDVGYDLTAEYSKEHNPDGTSSSTADLSILYRTLTIPSNITLTVEGQVLVNAVTGRPGAGHCDMDVTGNYSQIVLNGNISVENGAILEACGYIVGDGQITAKNGSEVRDTYVVKNWRGGSQASDMYNKTIFPFNEYDCNNIRCALYIETSASLLGNVKMYASSSYHYTRFPQIDQANGLIRLADGAYLIKTYDAAASNGTSAADTGRTTIQIYGGATFASSALKLKLSIITMDLSTDKFIYPVDGDISFELHNGNYIFNNDFKFLTGATVTVDSDATLTVSEGKTVIFYNEFNDVDNVENTKYADRSAATLTLNGTSTLSIQGTFAGIVNCETADTQVIIASGSTTTGVTTNEANGYRTGIRTLTFNIDIRTPAA